MTIPFFKYQGTGNDFVMIDDRMETFPKNDKNLVARLCHRRFGVGADGLILLQNHHELDFQMIYFNADGAEGSMCGNGGRCIVKFAYDLGLISENTRFMAVDGKHIAKVIDSLISLKMSNVSLVESGSTYSFTNTGSPHVVQFEDDLANFDVVGHGKKIRYSEAFAPEGTNVNFVQIEDDGSLFIRTYERGVEDETYSCGTGVTAAALVAHQQKGLLSPISIDTNGGKLSVSFKPDHRGFQDVILTGAAKLVFKGSIEI